IIPALFALPQSKIQFYRVLAVLSEIFFVQTKQQNLGNTQSITEIFCEVWAEKSRSKPTYPYLSPPNGTCVFRMSIRNGIPSA
ncbi:MAG: hypothetical protein Q4C93_05275, partial [Clostridia bacterium]|nr:hypothetical protein [Clostridia bacterium]